MSAASGSTGDPRVLFVMNLVLSALFCYSVIRGLVFVGAVEFSWGLFAGSTALLMGCTHLITR